MGMSASQARLLFISSRMHDIEMKSQNIANQKIRLASDSEQVSANYVKALNKTNLMVTDPLTQNTQQLAYNTIMSPDAILKSYSLRDVKNRVVVSNDVEAAFKGSKNVNDFLVKLGVSGIIGADETDETDEIGGVNTIEGTGSPSGAGGSTVTVYDESLKPNKTLAQKKAEEPKAPASVRPTSEPQPPTFENITYNEDLMNQAKEAIYSFDSYQSESSARTNRAKIGVASPPSKLMEINQSCITAYQEYQSACGAAQLIQSGSSYTLSNLSDVKNKFNSFRISVLTGVGGYNGMQNAQGYQEHQMDLYNNSPEKIAWDEWQQYDQDHATWENEYKQLERDWENYYDSAKVTTVENSSSPGGAGGAGDPGYTGDTVGDQSFDSAETDFYTSLYNQMKTDGYVGYDQKLLDSKEALANMLQNGEWFLSKVDENGKYNKTSLSSNTLIGEASDKNEIAKAEAEYNAATAKINRKEKLLDMELSKLDTEHNALNTEYDSVKNLISKNTEKSFNLFS